MEVLFGGGAIFESLGPLLTLQMASLLFFHRKNQLINPDKVGFDKNVLPIKRQGAPEPPPALKGGAHSPSAPRWIGP